MKKIINYLLAAIAVLSTFAANAGPMGYKDSWMMMGDISSNWREVFANYAITPRDAFGVSNTYMRSDNHTTADNVSEVTYTRLLHRWNEKNSQTNVWFMGGIGSAAIHEQNKNNEIKTIASPGIQFDYETTRLYFATTGRFYRASNLNHDYRSIKGGFSFYEPHYSETQPWFILEARRMTDLSATTEVTPMLRLINKSYFVEAGISNSHELRFNFMAIF